MSSIQAIILGIIQGITEFLPISSSGHLTLFQSIFGMENLDQFIVFDLVCHLGTLIAVIIVFFSQIKTTFFKDYDRFKLIVIGTLPLFPVLLILKPLKSLYNRPEFLGFFFITTAVLLYMGIRFGKDVNQNEKNQKKLKYAAIIGCFQTLALLPGVSRSGSTISSARMLGFSPKEAVQFSFLLSVPAILGGSALESLQIITGKCSVCSLSITQYLLGFLFSFIFGFGSLLLLIRIAIKEKFMFFVWYCLSLGIFSLFYFKP